MKSKSSDLDSSLRTSCYAQNDKNDKMVKFRHTERSEVSKSRESKKLDSLPKITIIFHRLI